jgi:protocatechuate 3,4-dioxygenase, beta subunit
MPMHRTQPLLLRREVLQTGIAALVFRHAAAADSSARQPTPGMMEGPYYPLAPLDRDADLTAIAGKRGRAQGQLLHVVGRVLNVEGEPVRGAQVEIWQANAGGRYRHPSDDSPVPLDPNFDGYGKVVTDAEGRFRFKTIKPGSYPFGAGWMRAPHIHFKVSGRHDRKTTQMLFENDPLNEQDPLLQRLGGNRSGIIAKVLPPAADMEPESLLVPWEIVVARG